MWGGSREPVTGTVELRRKAERDSILSACTGALGDVTLTDSAVIILYAAMLGASDMFSLITTALMPLTNGLLMIPMAWIATKIGNQSLIVRSCQVAVAMYILLCGAPFFGSGAVAVLIGSMIIFSVMHTAYVAGWFPMLDNILTPERRNSYLGKMRFLWQFSSAAFLFVVGLLIGKHPPLAHLQIVLFIAALVFAGRPFFISKIPTFAPVKAENFSLKTGLLKALHNKALVGYSIYLFALNLAAFGTIPLCTIYLKRYLQAPANVIVLISAVSLAGMLLGSLAAKRILQKFGIRNTLLGIHVIYGLTNGALFFMGKEVFSPAWTYIIIALLLFGYSFTYANAHVASTSEMMALATPGNKIMAMAFCGTFNSTGSGMSRLLTSLILGAGILAPSWQVGEQIFCSYQTIFLLYTVGIIFAGMFVVAVPAICPEGDYAYLKH